MEVFYHLSDPFRWNLNSFVRALKEVPKLIQMDLQTEKGFTEWFQKQKEELRSDPLVSQLSLTRDYIVHQGMLKPNSEATIGITEGRGIKAGLRFPIDPLMDSDTAMQQYVHTIKDSGDPLDILLPDEESLPCVQRVWRLKEFPQVEAIDLCGDAWLRVGQVISKTVQWAGGEIEELSLDCRHASQEVQFKLYDREKLQEWQKENKSHSEKDS